MLGRFSIFGNRTPVKQQPTTQSQSHQHMANMEVTECAGDKKADNVEKKAVVEKKAALADAVDSPIKQFDDVCQTLLDLEDKEKALKDHEEELEQVLRTRLEQQTAMKLKHIELRDEKRMIVAEIYRLKTKDGQLDNVLEPEVEVDKLLASTNELLANAMSKITETVKVTKQAFAQRKGVMANTDAEMQCSLENNDMTIIRTLVKGKMNDYVLRIQELAHEKFPVTKRGWKHILGCERDESHKVDQLKDEVQVQKELLELLKPTPIPEVPIPEEETRQKRKRSPVPDWASPQAKQQKSETENGFDTNGSGHVKEPEIDDNVEKVACEGCSEKFALDDGKLSAKFKLHCVDCVRYKKLNLLKKCELCLEVLINKADWKSHVEYMHWPTDEVKPKWMSKGTFLEIVSQPNFKDITRCKGCGRR